jgi:hypothetical protein
LKKVVYVFLRKDLGHTQRIVQAAHVCMEVGRRFPLPDERYRIIILGIRSEAKLSDVSKELCEHDIQHLEFQEPDMDMQRTAIATEPLDGEKAKLFARYRLLENE